MDTAENKSPSISNLQILIGLIVALSVVMGGIALALQSGSNAATGIVRERMNYMVDLERTSETLGAMVEGMVVYDPARAEALAVRLAEQAQQLPELFPPGSQQRGSNALAVVWANWPEFQRRQERFVAASEAVAQAIGSGDQAAIKRHYWTMADSCRDCHRGFRWQY